MQAPSSQAPAAIQWRARALICLQNPACAAVLLSQHAAELPLTRAFAAAWTSRSQSVTWGSNSSSSSGGGDDGGSTSIYGAGGVGATAWWDRVKALLGTVALEGMAALGGGLAGATLSAGVWILAAQVWCAGGLLLDHATGLDHMQLGRACHLALVVLALVQRVVSLAAAKSSAVATARDSGMLRRWTVLASFSVGLVGGGFAGLRRFRQREPLVLAQQPLHQPWQRHHHHHHRFPDHHHNDHPRPHHHLYHHAQPQERWRQRPHHHEQHRYHRLQFHLHPRLQSQQPHWLRLPLQQRFRGAAGARPQEAHESHSDAGNDQALHGGHRVWEQVTWFLQYNGLNGDSSTDRDGWWQLEQALRPPTAGAQLFVHLARAWARRLAYAFSDGASSVLHEVGRRCAAAHIPRRYHILLTMVATVAEMIRF
jgi:hypothetical protein